jgi:hypothetical protein
MAEILTRREIGSIPITPHSQIRDRLETGDLLFASGNMKKVEMNNE